MSASPSWVSDRDTLFSLSALEPMEVVQGNRVPGVRTILVVLSSRGMVFDVDALRQKILMAYPDAAVFFRTTLGRPLGIPSPTSVDLLIDFTGPGQRQDWCYARKLRRMVRFAVGRNAGFFRKRHYDRVFDEKSKKLDLPRDLLDRERFAQREVLALAGIALIPAGEATADLARNIALELPPLLHS